MPKSPNQKLKLLYLMEIMLQQTDERHPMTVPEMISQLAQRGVSAERKSIYGDLEALRTFGLDIVQTKSKTTGYYVGTRAFETPELKLARGQRPVVQVYHAQKDAGAHQKDRESCQHL